MWVSFIFDMAGVHLAFFVVLASVFCNFDSAGLQLARVLFIASSVALHIACVVFNFDESMVYCCLGWLTFR